MRAIVAALALGACYAPKPAAGTRCSASGACPAGLVCSPVSDTCETSGAAVDGPIADAATDAAKDGPRADAPIDGAPLTTTLRQQASKFEGANGNGLTLDLTSSPVAGDTLVLVGGNPGKLLSSVTGGGVATWTRLARSNMYENVEIWAGVTNGSTTTVTMTCTMCESPDVMWVGEFTNVVTTAPLDGSGGNDGAASPASPGTIATTNARDLLIFAASGKEAGWGAPTLGPWTMATEVDADNTTQIVYWRTVETTSTYGVTVAGGGMGWDAAFVALKRQ